MLRLMLQNTPESLSTKKTTIFLEMRVFIPVFARFLDKNQLVGHRRSSRVVEGQCRIDTSRSRKQRSRTAAQFASQRLSETRAG